MPAAAADYPTRPVHIIVGYPAGGSTDIVARIIGNWLGVKLGQQFIVENRPGAGNNIGTEAVVKAAPDGYTMLLVNSANTINASLYKKLNFNFLKDIDPVAALKDTSMQAKLKDLGGIVVAGSPEDFGKYLAAETAKWEKVVHAAKLLVE